MECLTPRTPAFRPREALDAIPQTRKSQHLGRTLQSQTQFVSQPWKKEQLATCAGLSEFEQIEAANLGSSAHLTRGRQLESMQHFFKRLGKFPQSHTVAAQLVLEIIKHRVGGMADKFGVIVLDWTAHQLDRNHIC